VLYLKHFNFVFSPLFFSTNYITVVQAEQNYTEECKEGKTVQRKADLTKVWNQNSKHIVSSFMLPEILCKLLPIRTLIYGLIFHQDFSSCSGLNTQEYQEVLDIQQFLRYYQELLSSVKIRAYYERHCT